MSVSEDPTQGGAGAGDDPTGAAGAVDADDPTQGQELGATSIEDPAAGQEDTSDDPTQSGGGLPGEDPTASG